MTSVGVFDEAKRLLANHIKHCAESREKVFHK
jgi:hypothetical protein